MLSHPDTGQSRWPHPWRWWRQLAADLAAALPGDVHTALSALLSAGRVTRLRLGVHAPAEPKTPATEKRGLSPQTITSALTTVVAVVQSYVNQGVLPRNVIGLVEGPKDAEPDDSAQPAADAPAGNPRPNRGPVRGRPVPRVGARATAGRLLAAVLLRATPVRSA